MSRIKTKAKGNRNRSAGLKWLRKRFEDQGHIWIGHYTVPEGRFSKDAFGFADAIIIVRAHGSSGVGFVQFKSNTWGQVGEYQKLMNKFGLKLMIVRKDDRKGFSVRTIEPEDL